MNSRIASSEVRIIEYPNGEIQRVQIVRAQSFRDIGFYRPSLTREAFESLCAVYRDEIIPAAELIFGDLFIFHVPQDLTLPFESGLGDRQAAARKYLIDHYPDEASRAFLKAVEQTGYLCHLKGRNPFRKSFVAYGEAVGFLSDNNHSQLRVNSSFFTFDLMDADSPYDIFGTPLGLMVKDGMITNPPLFGRQALLVSSEGKVCVRPVSLDELTISIKGTIYQRPQYRRTPASDLNDVVIIGERVIAVNPGGNTRIPSSGFVISTAEEHQPGEKVTYGGMEDISFGLQVGNSVIIDGVKSEGFISPFYNLRRLEKVSYPPALYSLGYDTDRAPRIVLGADEDDRPVILWLEGPGKRNYRKGQDSCGATLRETADIAEKLGIRNAVSLDGGGSAQILLNGRRHLRVSGRHADNSEKERPVPVGLVID